MLDERPRPDPAVRRVCVDRGRVPAPQLQRCGRFPPVREPVDVLQLHSPAGVAQLEEHASTADRLELMRVTDEAELPLALVARKPSG